jgi:hypothetical protein
VEAEDLGIEGVQGDRQELGGKRLDHRECRSREGIPETIYLFTDYWHGDVLDFLICDKAKAESAKFVMSGDYVRWKQVAKKEVDATKALMQGKIKLKGDLTYVVRNIKTVNKVIDLLCEIETLWPDEA